MELPAGAGLDRQLLKQVYVVSNKRFGGKAILKTDIAYCSAQNIAVIATAQDKKLHVISLRTDSKQPPDVKKYTFNSAVISISVAELETGFTVFALLARDAYLVSNSGTITRVERVPIRVATMARSENSVTVFGGTDEGYITKTDVVGSDANTSFKKVSESGICQIRLNRAGSVVACGFVNGSIGLFTANDLECDGIHEFRYGTIRCLAWNDSNTLLAFAAQDDNFYLMDIDSRHITCVSGHCSFVNSLSFDPIAKSGIRVMTCAEDAMIGCFDIIEGTPHAHKFGPFEHPIRAIACFKKFVITVDATSVVSLWGRKRPIS